MQEPSKYDDLRVPINLVPEKNSPNTTFLIFFDAQGFVYVEIRRGIYGLPQAGIMENKDLTKFLAKDSY